MSNYFVKLFAAAAFISGTITPVSAQSNQTQEAIGTLGNLFGALAQAGAKSKAKKGWAKISDPVKACVNMTLASRNLTVDQIVAAGVAPTDQRVAPLITFCDQILVAQLQTNVACNVSDSKGQQVASTCNQVFAKDENGAITEISRDDFIRAAGNGEKVQIAILELSSANSARLAEEQRLAAAERQAFLASPEGKRQAALAAAGENKRRAEQRRSAEARAEALESDKLAKRACENEFRRLFVSQRMENGKKIERKSTEWIYFRWEGQNSVNYILNYQLFTLNQFGSLQNELGLYRCLVDKKTMKFAGLRQI